MQMEHGASTSRAHASPLEGFFTRVSLGQRTAGSARQYHFFHLSECEMLSLAVICPVCQFTGFMTVTGWFYFQGCFTKCFSATVFGCANTAIEGAHMHTVQPAAIHGDLSDSVGCAEVHLPLMILNLRVIQKLTGDRFRTEKRKPFFTQSTIN